MSKRPPPAQQLAIVALVLVAGVAGVALLVLRGAAPLLLATCPVNDGRVAVVVGARSSGRGPTTTSARLQVFDAKTGERKVDAPLPTWRGADPPACLGPAGPDRVWLRIPGETQLEVRRLSDGGLVLSGVELAKRPGLTAGIGEIGWDFDRGWLTLATRDARRFAIMPDTLDARPYDHAVSLFGLERGFADAPLKTDVVTFYRGGAPGLVMRDRRRVTLQGDVRARLVVGGKPQGGDDFYHPHLLRARDGTVEHADPPGFLIAEETLVGSLRYRLVRVGLDGARLWSFDPERALPASWKYRPVPWTLSADGTLALHASERELLAIDVRTGALRWRRPL